MMNKQSSFSSTTAVSIISFAILLGIFGIFSTSCTSKEKVKETAALQKPIKKDTLPRDPDITNSSDYDRFGPRKLTMPPPGLTGKAIELVAVPRAYPDTTSRINIVLYNSNAGRITTGLHYDLEKYEKNKWQPLNFPQNYIFLDIGLTMDNGDALEFITSLHTDVNNYTPGKYRVVKKILFKFEAEFVVDSTYNIHMISSNHLGDAFEMTIPEIKTYNEQKIDTFKVIISNNSTHQELINSDDFVLSFHDKDNRYDFLSKPYSAFEEETYSLKPGKSMEFAIPAMSDTHRSNSRLKHTFGPGKYTITKWSKVDLYAEFELKNH